MEKSHVSMETNVCTVCGLEFETDAILLDRRLRESMERRTCTGWGMCDEHAKLRADGYIAIVECDSEKSGVKGKETIQPGDAYRLGHIAHLRAHVFAEVFNVPLPKEGVVFCDPEVIEALQKMQA